MLRTGPTTTVELADGDDRLLTDAEESVVEIAVAGLTLAVCEVLVTVAVSLESVGDASAVKLLALSTELLPELREVIETLGFIGITLDAVLETLDGKDDELKAGDTLGVERLDIVDAETIELLVVFIETLLGVPTIPAEEL